MPAPAIRCDGLSKRFRLGGTRATRFTELLAGLGRSAATVPTRWLGRSRDAGERELWALRDVSFEVAAGEVVGIVGRNGAGKSTLLNVLSRITRPTAGRIEIAGRVGSLLDVGTGFHPELTGRENVFLNGAILGMSRREIKAKFAEIVAFAEVERFLDTPVKRYSSGMVVRLAFAVAAHLEPEVLIVDEVLSVGDAAFQNKCLGKLDEVSRHGRTVLIVSHHLPSVVNFCGRALLLEAGRITAEGPASEVVGVYLSRTRSAPGEALWPDPGTAPGGEAVRLRSVRVLQDGQEGPTADVAINIDVVIEIAYRTLRGGESHFAGLWLRDHSGTVVLASNTAPGITIGSDAWHGRPQPAGIYVSRCRLPANFLNDATYTVTALVSRPPGVAEVREENAVAFRVHDTAAMRDSSAATPGVVRPGLAWETETAG